MALAFRTRNFQPFLRFVERDDDRYTGVQYGIVSYRQTDDQDDTYQVSLIEMGARCDHLCDPISQAFGVDPEELSVSSPLVSDKDLIRKPSKKSKKDKKRSKKRSESVTTD